MQPMQTTTVEQEELQQIIEQELKRIKELINSLKRDLLNTEN